MSPAPSFLLKRTSKDHGTFWNIKWNMKRSSYPPLLSEVGFPEDLWSHTYDHTIHLQNQLSNTSCAIQEVQRYNECYKSVIVFALLMCYIPAWMSVCFMDLVYDPWFAFYGTGIITLLFVGLYYVLVSKCLPKPNDELHMTQIDQTQAWHQFVQEQNVLYRTYGIHVTSLGGEEFKDCSHLVGGLRFALIGRSQSPQFMEAEAEADSRLREMYALTRQEEEECPKGRGISPEVKKTLVRGHDHSGYVV
mmetsp:Transcript_4690/g.5638  ORF Transcript_4690/g.5638 Transcript_4690/m.5638 type:complete len:248 (-) Transcript_4690:151-894(-)|eukprot:CAMPEP_0195293282 /NCGR_PEP_ID=MMETSP0707-20130614/12090_1 /TAXON_ID=33640 /ORGANISM="Asterionellopsis glacialis, Strain CCMP134" /LENGTH=247 /DNA_ID=CAMNT_0040353959 /DNA_START=44 /DNA_END=787 /DNA_ORIENTATION=-